FATDEHGQTRTFLNVITSFIRPFDLAKAPLIRSCLIKKPDGNHTWVVDMHHIISDGTSHTILTEDFTALYSGKELKPLPLQYKDFAFWQQQWIETDEIKVQLKYWLDLLAGEIPQLNLPADKIRPSVFSFAGDNYGFSLAGEEAKKFKEINVQRGGTLYMNILAALNVLFYKYTGQEDIVIGSGVAGRRHADLQGIVGMFINTLVMRNYPDGDKTYEHFLKEVIACSIKGFENQDVQFEDLVDHLKLERDVSRNPVFDVILMVQNFYQAGKEVGGLRADRNITDDGYKNPSSNFDMTFLVNEQENDIFININYYAAIFKPVTIQRMASHFKNIINNVSSDSLIKLKDIEIISAAEKKKIIYEFNDTEIEYPKDKTIHQLFAEQAERTPDQVALVGAVEGEEKKRRREEVKNFGVETLRATSLHITYLQLNEQSDRLAELLIEKNVLPDTTIGIMMERSIEMIIAIMSILKSGGAYLPIDPEYPQERIDYMLKDSNAKVLIDKSEARTSKYKTNPNVQKINDQNKNIEGLTVLNLNHLDFEFVSNFGFRNSDLNSSNLAYIMYTSGSTGKPKAVMVMHRNVVRLVKNSDFVTLSKETRILQTGAPVFDATTFEIWGSLLNGGTLVLVHKELILNASWFAKTLNDYCINTLWLSAPLFNQLIEENIKLFEPLSYLLVGGDRLSPEHINRVKSRFTHLKIINGYGPTENTTFSTSYLIEKEFEQNIPIGKPISNSTAYIIDKNDRLQPVGICGELLVGGDGVALGYMNDPELTAERFIYFHQSSVISHHLIHYRTGDLACWLPDGNIEFLGRIDHQVKIRGYRIELGEIENRLLKNKNIKDTVVIERSMPGRDLYLCAYIVPIESQPGVNPVDLEVSSLREFLLRQLPDYMIPTHFFQIEKIPTTLNGKIDKKELKKMGEILNSGVDYSPPTTEIEKLIAVIWKDVLRIEDVGIFDNFFDLGGNSLNIITINNKINTAFKKNIPLVKLFAYPTIHSLAEYLNQKEISEIVPDNKIKESVDIWEESICLFTDQEENNNE
ncbi:MAG TPA: amino acid adenylation domain-containing protein, partial [Candidatus Deferrimicrobium sp.]|nr:amino acid adenylation domain-containing protein [Candidatus Deferrimicrobium sp.]